MRTILRSLMYLGNLIVAVLVTIFVILLLGIFVIKNLCAAFYVRLNASIRGPGSIARSRRRQTTREP